ncbi:BrnA antitoxin family protein, partial [uncultured Mailhella sp.]|uniref:BrnA antitoxin family protein n=1 Tax=uncultured Mailhella sp. TaxID=1981031 RepID=UPI00262BAC65
MENISVLFQRGKPMRKNSEHITRFELDISNPPPLTAEQQAELETLAARPNSAIDYSDIPPIEDASRFYRPVKEMTTIRLDADILAWLRSQGKG